MRRVWPLVFRRPHLLISPQSRCAGAGGSGLQTLAVWHRRVAWFLRARCRDGSGRWVAEHLPFTYSRHSSCTLVSFDATPVLFNGSEFVPQSGCKTSSPPLNRLHDQLAELTPPACPYFARHDRTARVPRVIVLFHMARTQSRTSLVCIPRAIQRFDTIVSNGSSSQCFGSVRVSPRAILKSSNPTPCKNMLMRARL